ncbi:red chlorophyll catabolite reductase [Chroococcidiopsis sp. CCALA 051]|uniref:red chlorophyll catabolite reductase n=1 Tax=Chroococcidiopsis sp. CCALA 051 TaxID=869949 RepID=UPI000D0DDAF5|nr:red chlorophyll catabolite reductase [Chroococcidiopsis sp. CCALA 051]PSM45590.1 red chlorophyll catabolite reductase [Chroococcidiopsis sp. CCALA 051]
MILERVTVFDRLREIQGELYQKLTDRFDLRPEPANHPLQSFCSPDRSVTGSLQTFTGTNIDWLVYSFLHAAKTGFCAMRLTTWLSPQIRVPHLVFEFGTMPNVFLYMDYVPRVDLWSDLEYVEQFYEPLDSTYLKWRDEPNFSLFVSKGLYVRQFQSPAHLCFTCAGTEDSLAAIRTTAHEMCDRWLTWIEQAEPVPVEDRAALAQRDLRLRQISAERDPDNAIAAKIFGAELTEKLVRSLWNRESISELC